jgi:hypothetical protein
MEKYCDGENYYSRDSDGFTRFKPLPPEYEKWFLEFHLPVCISARMCVCKYVCRGAQKCIHTVPPTFSLTVLSFDMMALAFVRLVPSFERISHYATYITFRFNFENVPR